MGGREGADAFQTIVTVVVEIRGGGKAPYVDYAVGAEESQERMSDMVLENSIGREGRGGGDDFGIECP